MYSISNGMRRIFRLTCFFSILPISTSVFAEVMESDCGDPTAIELNTTIRTIGADEPQCFAAYVGSAGILWIDVSIPGPDLVQPRLEFPGPNCDRPRTDEGEGFAYMERLAASMWLEIRAPGNYSFCVAAQDPRQRLAEYKVRVAYVESPAREPSYLTEDEPDPEPFNQGCLEGVLKLTEDEPDPEPFNQGCPGGVLKLTEDEPDPEPFNQGCRGGVFKLTEEEPDPEPKAGSLRRALYESCRLGEIDDHGETYACATRLHPGRPVTGEICNESGDDRDLFWFHLAELATVEIESTGETDTFGGLYDRYGHRLATADEGGDERNFRMVKTLVPGGYFVRVEGRYQAKGAYRLSVDASR